MNNEATPLSDEQAAELRQTYAQCEPGLRAMLRHRLRDDAEIDDCVQTVALKWLQCGRSVAPAARRAWLFRVAANEAALFWRRESAGRSARQRAVENQGFDPALLGGRREGNRRKLGEESEEERWPVNGDDSRGATGESRLVRRETIETIRAALEELPEEQQTLMRLRFEHDLTFAEISERLGIPLGTALTRARLAIAKLRKDERLVSLLEP